MAIIELDEYINLKKNTCMRLLNCHIQQRKLRHLNAALNASTTEWHRKLKVPCWHLLIRSVKSSASFSCSSTFQFVHFTQIHRIIQNLLGPFSCYLFSNFRVLFSFFSVSIFVFIFWVVFCVCDDSIKKNKVQGKYIKTHKLKL